MLYNAFWTSWPCIFTFVFERDVDSRLSVTNPALYQAGPRAYYFNFKVFWRWMGFAFVHGALSFFLTSKGLEGTFDSDGRTMTHWVTSTVAFTVCLHLATYKLFLESTFLNVINL